jgi:acetyl-CoA C-acetyltransferase
MSEHMSAWIVDAIRTPRAHGNAKSAIKDLTPVALGAQLLQKLAARQQPASGQLDTVVEDVVLGCATQYAGQGSNFARLTTIAAGWHERVAALTINRACCSGMSAVVLAALQARANDGVCVGGGVEMMSSVPLAADQGSLFFDAAFNRQHTILPLGVAADAIASRYGITREACDVYAAQSQARAQIAQAQGRFTSMLPIYDSAGKVLLAQEQNLRPGNTAAFLATRPAAFAEIGAQVWNENLARHFHMPPGQTLQYVHHVGNSPTAADAAAWVLLGSQGALARHGWRPRARIMAHCELGADPGLALTGVVDVTHKVLARAGLRVDEIDVFEVNEAFAAAMLHWMRAMGLESSAAAARVNPNGGTLAFGHAMGATGAILISMALDELERSQGRYGLIAMSGAAGLASAMIIECYHHDINAKTSQ